MAPTTENPLAVAIERVELAASALKTTEAANAQAQAKFEAAKVAAQTAKDADADAAREFNQALDRLIAAANEARVIR